MAITTYENRSRFTQRLQSWGSRNVTPEDDPSRRSAGWYVHHFIGSAFQLGAMATTYYASRTEPLNMDAHTNVSWALLFIAIIVIPGLLTFVESFVEPDGSGQDVVAGVTIMLALGGINTPLPHAACQGATLEQTVCLRKLTTERGVLAGWLRWFASFCGSSD